MKRFRSRSIAGAVLAALVCMAAPTANLRSRAVAQERIEANSTKVLQQSAVAKKKLSLAIQTRIGQVRDATAAPAIWAAVYRSENHRPAIEVQGIQHAGARKDGSDINIAEDDLVHLGSCTKAMTATMIGQAISAGKVNWTTTLGEIFGPNETNGDSHSEAAAVELHDWGTVTIHELLTHRSGAPGNADWSALHEANPKDVVAARLSLLAWLCEQNRPSKSRYLYSNVGYALLGHILEKIEGEPWETLIERDLFEPLGIKSAGFGPVKAEEPLHAAWGHYAEVTAGGVIGESLAALLGRKPKPNWKPVRIDNPPPLGPAGRCHMQIGDWAKFVSVYAHLEPDPRLKINAATWKQLTNAKDQKGGQPYAGGWVPFGSREDKGFTLYHNGSNTTWYCVATTRPHDQRFALVVANCFSPEIVTSCDSLAEDLVKQKLEAMRVRD